MSKSFRLALLLFISLLGISFILLIPGTYMLSSAIVRLNDYAENKEYQIDKIKFLGNDTYRAKIQCTREPIDDIIRHCPMKSYISYIPCQKYPCQTEYTEIEFVCSDSEYLHQLKLQSRSVQESGNQKYWKGWALLTGSSIIIFSFVGLSIIGMVAGLLECYIRFRMPDRTDFSPKSIQMDHEFI